MYTGVHTETQVRAPGFYAYFGEWEMNASRQHNATVNNK